MATKSWDEHKYSLKKKHGSIDILILVYVYGNVWGFSFENIYKVHDLALKLPQLFKELF